MYLEKDDYVVIIEGYVLDTYPDFTRAREAAMDEASTGSSDIVIAQVTNVLSLRKDVNEPIDGHQED